MNNFSYSMLVFIVSYKRLFIIHVPIVYKSFQNINVNNFFNNQPNNPQEFVNLSLFPSTSLSFILMFFFFFYYYYYYY